MFGQQLSNVPLYEQSNEFWSPVSDLSKSRSLSSESQSTEDYENETIQNQYESIITPQYPLSEQKCVKSSGFQIKLKTELCRNFIYAGNCRFGDKCSFAHGYEELQWKTHISSNYKTKPCKSFFGTGFCQYGERCQFLHSEIKYSIQSANLKQYQQKLNTLTLIGNQDANAIELLECNFANKLKRPDLFKNNLQFNLINQNQPTN